MSQPPKLLDRVRDRIRLKHYSIRTEDAYVQWIKRSVILLGKRHPAKAKAVLIRLAVAKFERQEMLVHEG